MKITKAILTTIICVSMLGCWYSDVNATEIQTSPITTSSTYYYTVRKAGSNTKLGELKVWHNSNFAQAQYTAAISNTKALVRVSTDGGNTYISSNNGSFKSLSNGQNIYIVKNGTNVTTSTAYVRVQY